MIERNVRPQPGERTLTVTKLTKEFGGLTALNDFSMYLDQGELIGLIGPNGAGKTTAFNLLTGVYTPTSGTIEFYDGEKTHELGGKKPYHICRYGLGRTFQNIRVFKDLPVLDNVIVAMQERSQYSLLESFVRSPRFYREEKIVREKSMELLEFMGLADKADDIVRNLPYGDQRHLEIARALATNPQILLLDEPAAGMNPAETAALTEMIAWLRNEKGLTILLIEHDMSLVMTICERLYVLDHGTLIATGTPEEIRNNPRVIEAYLGQEG